MMAPARELAVQISQVMKEFVEILFKKDEFSFCYLIGGDKLEYDLERIEVKGANIVVATPGRLFDLAINKHALSFRKLEFLVMDEADKLVEMGHELHLNSLLDYMPKQRRTGLFSATMPT